MTPEDVPPSRSDGAAPPSDASTTTIPRFSTLRCAIDKMTTNSGMVCSLLEKNGDDVHVGLIDASMRALLSLLQGKFVPESDVARLYNLSRGIWTQGTTVTQALKLLGESLHAMSMARNEWYTLNGGKERNEQGMSLVTLNPTMYYGERSEDTPCGSRSLRTVKEEAQQVKTEPECHTQPVVQPRDISFTSGVLRGVTGNVDVDHLNLFNNYITEENNAPVKREMDDFEFFEHQHELREMREMEERMMNPEGNATRDMEGRGGRKGNTFECNECGDFFPNKRKLNAHKKQMHPLNGEPVAVQGVRVSARINNTRRGPVASDDMTTQSASSSSLSTPTTSGIIDAVQMNIEKSSSVTLSLIRAPLATPSKLPSCVTPSTPSTPALAPTTSGLFECSLCHRCFSGANQLRGHSGHCRRAHGMASPTPSSRKRKRETPVKTPLKGVDTSYACPVCARFFDNSQSLTDHMRMCMNANDVDSSPRAVVRRGKVTEVANPVARIGKRDPLPMSPLAMPTVQRVASDKERQVMDAAAALPPSAGTSTAKGKVTRSSPKVSLPRVSVASAPSPLSVPSTITSFFTPPPTKKARMESPSTPDRNVNPK